MNEHKNNILKLLTFNVWGLPVWLPKIDKVKRYKSIPDSISSICADIVCLQEAFDPKLDIRIINEMKNTGYYYNNDYFCTKNLLLIFRKDCFGGLMTFSRYPILWEYYFPHLIQAEMKVDEKIGMKGFLITKIQSPWGGMIVVNIHLYSGRSNRDENIRLNQIKYLMFKLDSLSVANQPIIIQGDLNLIHPGVIKSNINNTQYNKSSVYDFLASQMSFVDTKTTIKEEDLTYDVLNNQYAGIFYNRFEQRQKFDFCLYKFGNLNVISTSASTIFKFPFAISDHYGVYTQIEIEKVINKS